MITKRVSYQSKEPGIGTYIFQGFAGGMLVGYLLMLLVLIGWPSPVNFVVMLYVCVPMFVVGGLGTIKAIPFWALNRFLGFRLPVLARIISGGFLPTSLWLFLLIREGKASDETLLISTGAVFLLSLPTSLLIGSRVRPWEFFTYGSMVFRENGIYRRHTVTDAPVILGGLMLRIIATGGLLLSVLVVACGRELIGKDIWKDFIFYYFPMFYFALSVYLTFRSPRKSVLLILGVILNVPLGLPLYLGSKFFIEIGWQAEDSTALFLVCTIFLAAWTGFIATQLSVTSKKDLLTDISHATHAMTQERDPGHQCLGSRFADWQERFV